MVGPTPHVKKENNSFFKSSHPGIVRINVQTDLVWIKATLKALK